MFFCEFFKIFKNRFTFDKTPPVDCFLCLSVNFENTSGKLLFHAQVAEFQPPGAVKIISQVLFNNFIQEREVAIRRRSFTGCDMPT